MNRLFSIILILILSFAVYAKSLSCFFFSDDFLTLTYLTKIFEGNWQVLYERLTSSWFDKKIALFYRPIIDILFCFDYLIWRNNSFGYHLSNLLLHMGTSVLVFLFSAKLSSKNFKQFSLCPALFSALIFAVYPLHVEPVVWLVARADLVATFFILLALLFFNPENKQKKLCYLASPLCYFFALLSKEIAICFPFIILSYIICFSDLKNTNSLESILNSKRSGKVVISYLIEITRTLIPYCLITCFYLFLRYLILGTILGGYVGSIGEVMNANSPISSFLRASNYTIDYSFLKLIAFPFNQYIFGESSCLEIILRVMYIILACVTFMRAIIFVQNKFLTKIITFFGLSSLLAILPAMQVLGMTASLSNSRIFYCASAFYIPFFVFISYPFYLESNILDVTARNIRTLRNAYSSLKTIWIFIMIIMLVDLSVVCNLSINTWSKVSNSLINLSNSLKNELKKLEDNKKIVLLNFMGNIEGVHANYLSDEFIYLLKPDCRVLDNFNRILFLNKFQFNNKNISWLKQLIENRQEYKFFWIDKSSGKLVEKIDFEKNNFDSIDLQKFSSNLQDLGIKSGKRIYVLKLNKIFFEPINPGILELAFKGQRSRYIRLYLSTDSNVIPSDKEYKDYYLSFSAANENLENVINNCDLSLSLFDILESESSKNEYLYIEIDGEAKISSCVLHQNTNSATIEILDARIERKNDGTYVVDHRKSLDLFLTTSEKFIKASSAKSILVQQSKANFSFDFGDTNARALNSGDYAVAEQYKLNFNSGIKKISFGTLLPGSYYQWRICALDSLGNRLGYFSYPITVEIK